MTKQDRSTIDTYLWKFRIRPAIGERAEFRCEDCGRFIGTHGDVDHIVPRAHCDAAMIDPCDPCNLQYLCKSCHSLKTNSERWAGHQRKDRAAPRRSKVTGRDRYLSALRNLANHQI